MPLFDRFEPNSRISNIRIRILLRYPLPKRQIRLISLKRIMAYAHLMSHGLASSAIQFELSPSRPSNPQTGLRQDLLTSVKESHQFYIKLDGSRLLFPFDDGESFSRALEICTCTWDVVQKLATRYATK